MRAVLVPDNRVVLKVKEKAPKPNTPLPVFQAAVSTKLQWQGHSEEGDERDAKDQVPETDAKTLHATQPLSPRPQCGKAPRSPCTAPDD